MFNFSELIRINSATAEAFSSERDRNRINDRDRDV
jgi:hypothetical protein